LTHPRCLVFRSLMWTVALSPTLSWLTSPPSCNVTSPRRIHSASFYASVGETSRGKSPCCLHHCPTLAESMHVSSLQYSSFIKSVDTDCSRVGMDCNTALPDPPPYASVASAAQPSPSAFESDNRHASVSPMLRVARSRFCRAVPDSFCTHR
jgi:hypothetical protein